MPFKMLIIQSLRLYMIDSEFLLTSMESQTELYFIDLHKLTLK